jgi:DNA repair photolyase
VAVYVSVSTLDGDDARKLEPRAAAPYRRIQAIRALTQAGVPVGVSLAPVIPFITDDQMEQVLAAASEAGARAAFYTMLRLPWEVKDVFVEWLEAHFPDRAARVLHRIEDLRGGKRNDPRFGSRMRGEGIWADLVRQRFARAVRTLGLNQDRIELDKTSFVPPARAPKAPASAESGAGKGADAPQLSLF